MKNAIPGHHRIDPEKVRAAIRRMRKDQVFCLLDRAVDLLSQQGLLALVEGYVNPRDLRPESEAAQDMLAAIRKFEETSLHRGYYEPFDVTYKNCNELSRGTETWKADFERLLKACVRKAKARDFAEAREGFAILFSLLRRLDESSDEILFFGDEGGSWMMGIDWSAVLPAWFRCLASTAKPEEYARQCTEVMDCFVHYDREDFLALARRLAPPEQRRALAGGETAEPAPPADP
jgi:hypothetical protein